MPYLRHMNEKLTLLFLFVAGMILIACMKTTRKKQIIFLGDSITHTGTGYTGYITLLQNKLQQADLAETYTIKASGWPGNGVGDLLERAGKDVIQHAPYMTVIFIGINDVWHKGTTPEAFASQYIDLVNNLRQADMHVVLCTLPLIGEQPDGNPHDAAIDTFSQWIRQYATDQRMLLIDVRKAFTDYLAQHNTHNAATGILTTDGVHLTADGNELLANTIWQQLQPWLRK